MTTFANLRASLHPPTADQVAAVFKSELLALADEFTAPGDAGVLMFGRCTYHAERLALQVLAELAGKDSNLAKLLAAYDRGRVAAFPVHQVAEDIILAAEDFSDVARGIADEWLAEVGCAA